MITLLGKRELVALLFFGFRLVCCLSLFVWDLTSRKHAYITLTPLNPTFIIVKLGFTGVYIIFLISAQKHRLWVLVRVFYLKIFSFWS